jgi:hypothetical protein
VYNQGRPGPTIIVKPSQAAELRHIILRAPERATIVLDDGIYKVYNHIRIEKEGISLRSKSGNRQTVIIDGEYRGYLIQIAAPNVTVADLTIKRAKYHHIHIVGNGDNARLLNLHLIDARQQFVKANPSGGDYCDNGLVQNCYFEMTEKGREKVDPRIGGCYTGGVDALSVQGWVVQDNRFENIYCTNGGLPTHMVLFWKTSRDPVVQRNLIVNCARGIGFGLGPEGGHRQYDDTPIPIGIGVAGHIGGAIRNNFIFSEIGDFFDTGIGLEQAWGVTVADNIIFSNAGGFSAIDIRFPNSNPTLRNNRHNMRITVRDKNISR